MFYKEFDSANWYKKYGQKVLILEAADRETDILIVVVPVYITIIVDHASGPGVEVTVGCSTPQLTVLTDGEEQAGGASSATREGGKPGLVGCSRIRVLPVHGAGSFKLATGCCLTTQVSR